MAHKGVTLIECNSCATVGATVRKLCRVSHPCDFTVGFHGSDSALIAYVLNADNLDWEVSLSYWVPPVRRRWRGQGHRERHGGFVSSRQGVIIFFPEVR